MNITLRFKIINNHRLVDLQFLENLKMCSNNECHVFMNLHFQFGTTLSCQSYTVISSYLVQSLVCPASPNDFLVQLVHTAQAVLTDVPYI